MIAAREVHVAESPAATLHLLQGCKIAYDGPAPAADYFKPVATGTQADGVEVLEAAFRGRFMKGCEMPLPEGFTGAVVERREGCSEEGPTFSWHSTATFSSFHHWNHDTAPGKSDALRRAMEWAALASHIHAPIDPEEVAKEVETAAAKKAAVSESA